MDLPRNSRCQSPSESDCFLENGSPIVTSSRFGVYPCPTARYSHWSYVREDLIDNQMCCLWLLLGRAGDRIVFICNTTGLIISPYMSPGKTASQLYTALMGHSFPGSSAGKESACNAEDPGLISGSGTFAGEGIRYLLQCSWASQVAQTIKNPPTREGNGCPLQYSGLEESMKFIVHGVTKSGARLNGKKKKAT